MGVALIGALLGAAHDSRATALSWRSNPTPTTTAPPAPAAAALPTPTPSMLLIGDSVADTLRDALAAETATRGISFVGRVRPGCGMITGIPAYPTGSPIPWGPGCADGTPSFLSDSVHLANPQVVLWLSTWETADRIINGGFYQFGTPAADTQLLQLFDASRATLTSKGARLVMVTIAPHAVPSTNAPTDNPTDDAQYEHLNALFELFASQHSDTVTVVDLASIVCPTGPPCPALVDGIQLRPDGGHFSSAGANWAAPRLLDAVMRVLYPAPRATFR